VAETNDKVMELVERELERKPDTSTSDLFALAQQLDPGMKELTIRQFHARYPLQVKRKKSLKRGGGRRRRKSRTPSTRGPDRASARKVLTDFAHEVAKAGQQGPAAVIELMSGLDEWVDRIEKASKG
jgi:hypothetical protein